MASVNVNPEDIIQTASNDHEESDFRTEGYTPSLNRAYEDDDDEEEDLLGTNTIEEADDQNLVACLAPRDKSVKMFNDDKQSFVVGKGLLRPFHT